jgi:alanine racemase
MRETSVVEVNLSAIDRNMGVLRSMVGPSCGLCPIVKGDAYGLGAPRIARRLVASGADMLAVYSPEQAAAITRVGLAAPILVLMPVYEIRRSDDLYRALVSDRLHLVLHDEAHLDHLIRLAERFGAVVPVHVEIDTGMSRGGAAPEEAMRMIQRVAGHRWMRLAGIFTHFSNANADPARTASQLAIYDRTLALAGSAVGPECLQHVASTYSLLRHPRFHRAMVRFGLGWAGYGVDELDGGEIIAAAERLEPAVTWSSRIVQIKRVEAGTSVGYGSLWTAPRASVLGLVPVGYSDGYPRALPALAAAGSALAKGGGKVAVVESAGEETAGATSQSSRGVTRRRFAPIVGAVNMDQVTIDLTDLFAGGNGEVGGGPAGRAACGSVGVGSRIELISPDPAAPNHLPRVAAAAGTIPHEMLCRLAPHAKRVYVSEHADDSAGDLTIDAPRVASAG